MIEGSDGAGKTTMRRHIYHRLIEKGHQVFSTRAASWLDVQAAQLITNARWFATPFDEEELIAAYITDKQELCTQILQPQLTQRHVLSDRYIISDVVYCSVLFGIRPERIWEAFQRSTVIVPDCILFIDTPADLCVRRLAQRSPLNRNRWDEPVYQEQIHILLRRFLLDEVPEGFPIVRVDNNGPLEETLAFLDEKVLPGLGLMS